MLSFVESEDTLAQMANELPPEIMRELNLGIVLLPDELLDEEGFLILGQYHVEPMGLGRYVTINYGSMVAAFRHLTKEAFAKELRSVLFHELTHHLESLAGDKSLEVQDEIDRYEMRKLGH